MGIIASHPTKYNNVFFRSRLESRWAAFFDLAGWKWEYEPIDYTNWVPDFRVEFPCGHSDCPKTHSLMVEVKPYYSIDEFKGHPCMDYMFGGYGNKKIPVDSSAAFGINPEITYWEMAHGAGGGVFSVNGYWVENAMILWKKAGNIVQWKPEGGPQ
jgi:hypothetical protein